MCQGKMPMAVRTRYESMRNEGNSAQIDFMLHNFDEALLHPDDQDAADARAFAKKVCCKDSTEKSV